MPGQHALISPSASHRYLNCPGSLLPHAELPNESGEAAALGTICHEISEQRLKTGEWQTNVGDVRECEGFTFTITQEHLNWCEAYVEWCEELPGDHYVEMRVRLDHWLPIEDQFGTSDHVACEPGRLTITDAKFGGHEVEVEDNTQELMYALGVYDELNDLYDFKEIVLRICQPRLGNFLTWSIPVERLLEFGEYLRERVTLALQPNAPRIPGEKQCQFCKLKPCDAQLEWSKRVMLAAFDDLDNLSPTPDEMPMGPPDVAALTPEQVRLVLDNRGMLRGFIDACEKRAEAMLHHGESLPGWKLVVSRTHRAWKDSRAAADRLTDMGVSELDLYKLSFVSPAQAEELLPRKQRKELADLWDKPPGKPTLAPESDKRPVYQPPTDAFDDLDGETW